MMITVQLLIRTVENTYCRKVENTVEKSFCTNQ